MSTILFLDFDGVLHRTEKRFERLAFSYFEFVDPLAAALEPFPNVEIVISSSWRSQEPLKDLRGCLGLLGARVIGKTGAQENTRFDEIRAHPAFYRRPWIALDDDVLGWWLPQTARLVRCDTYQALGEPGKLGELVEKIRIAPLIARVAMWPDDGMQKHARPDQIVDEMLAQGRLTEEEHATLVRVCILPIAKDAAGTHWETLVNAAAREAGRS